MRATSAAAAAPNRRIIGGAGTSWPPLDPPLEPPLEDDELELLELELALELLEVLVLLPPKLLDPPLDVLVELPPVEVLEPPLEELLDDPLDDELPEEEPLDDPLEEPPDEPEDAVRNRADKRAWLADHDYAVVEVRTEEVERDVTAVLHRLAAALG